MSDPHPCDRRGGFTLVEMMISISVSLIVILGVMSTFVNNRKTYERMGLEQEMQQQVRSAMKTLQRDLRLCGSGVVMGEPEAFRWFPSLTGATTLPYLTTDAAGNDVLSMVGYSGAAIGTLRYGLSPGATNLELTPNPGISLPYLPRVGDVLVLGSVEAVKVTSVSGYVVRFTTDPTGTEGTRLSYPAGFDIYELAQVTYRLETWNGISGLIREDSRFTYSQEADKFIALHVEDFDVSITLDQIDLAITGMTRRPLAGYEAEADEHPRFTLSVDQHVRNDSPLVFIQFWDSNVLGGGAPSPTPSPTSTPSPTATPRPHSNGNVRSCWCDGTPESVNHP